METPYITSYNIGIHWQCHKQLDLETALQNWIGVDLCGLPVLTHSANRTGKSGTVPAKQTCEPFIHMLFCKKIHVFSDPQWCCNPRYLGFFLGCISNDGRGPKLRSSILKRKIHHLRIEKFKAFPSLPGKPAHQPVIATVIPVFFMLYHQVVAGIMSSHL